MAKFMTSKVLLKLFLIQVMHAHDNFKYLKVSLVGLAGMGPSLSQTRGAPELSCVTNFTDKLVTTSPFRIDFITDKLVFQLA